MGIVIGLMSVAYAFSKYKSEYKILSVGKVPSNTCVKWIGFDFHIEVQ